MAGSARDQFVSLEARLAEWSKAEHHSKSIDWKWENLFKKSKQSITINVK